MAATTQARRASRWNLPKFAGNDSLTAFLHSEHMKLDKNARCTYRQFEEAVTPVLEKDLGESALYFLNVSTILFSRVHVTPVISNQSHSWTYVDLQKV